ncbi:MAG: DNA polymerase III subunit alpha [candidate division KSB1 bacterium]|nr:DNA polymerase III subunit alpha [candidate division KSB1 bacterium]MDZ7303322.1 DNA polymerase III subunit alpha [candidate division KSB1 bacterium]MDZ7310428.1 DNA polymerase III subunit alpha [candidate division KSB1 bacterium]
MLSFVHLHNHSHYSLLDGACRIEDLVEAAKRCNMPALALTDHGNMFGTIEFYKTCRKAGIKPVIGVEAYMAPRSRKEKTVQKGNVSDASYHLLLLAKNLQGYKNLMRLVSIGFLEGFYYRPRIDREVLAKYREGIIVLSACLKGEVANKLLNEGYEAARKVALEYREIFGDDYYLEIHNHHIPEEDNVREGVLQLSRDLSIPVVATNDTHYLKREHAMPHDVLLCLQTGKDRDDPNRLRYTTDEIYFKSVEEMQASFPENPEALNLSVEIADKCNLELDFKSIHLPTFKIPEPHSNRSLDEYLEQLAFEGVKKRYKQVTPEIDQRLRHELEVIKQTGYAGYFLIVQDFIQYARSAGIPVGPGRGSAAGSLVSYCIGITNIDPLKYNLIFERFLNPERITMPDIDIDFCYERREEIIDYVRQKYGENNVTQIITFGTMAARAVIRDVGRVLKLRYSDVDKIAKMIPAAPGITLDKALETVSELRALVNSDATHRQLIDYSQVLEGLARHASTHAAGVVITPDELTNYTPLYKSNTGDVTTQYDMKALELVGVLKMDFLGLRTLTVMDKTVKMLRQKGVEIDLDHLPLDDPRTYELFGNGETIGLFQFESSGMREYLKKLKPQCLDDLIAMNALYRPGPMEMIDDFIARKHGLRKIEYLHPALEPILRETYGVIVYQEQVMRIASELAGFTLGGADLLRRAMGKKIPELMAEQRKQFVSGAKERGVSEHVANQIFDVMDKFAGYGFNKSHAAGYSLVAYQTGYLKAHFPAEFMAATLTSEMTSTSRIVTLIEECRRLGVPVLPPDVNESFAEFVVIDDAHVVTEPKSSKPNGTCANVAQKAIRYGLGAIKNVGLGAIESIVKARQTKGKFSSLFDFCSRVDLRLVNKKVLESLIQAGAMDSLAPKGNRNQLFQAIDLATAYAQRFHDQRSRGQVSIFDQGSTEMITEPPLPEFQDWPEAERLNREKDFLGLYLSSHPLQRFREEVSLFSSTPLQDLEGLPDGAQIMICGIITNIKTIVDRKGASMAFLTFEDFAGSTEAIVFSDTYAAHRERLQPEAVVVLVGRTSTREDEPTKILVEKVMSLEEAWQEIPKKLTLEIPVQQMNDTTLQQLLKLLRANQGSCQLFFRLRGEDASNYHFRSRALKVRPNASLLQRAREFLGPNMVRVDVAIPNGRLNNRGRPEFSHEQALYH